MSEAVVQDNPKAEKTAKWVYILYLIGLFTGGAPGIIGVIMAYINRGDAPEWLKSHYQFQIRTFWIGGLYLFIGVILVFFIIGYFVILFWVFWLIVRCVKGMKALDRKVAHPNPKGWLF